MSFGAWDSPVDSIPTDVLGPGSDLVIETAPDEVLGPGVTVLLDLIPTDVLGPGVDLFNAFTLRGSSSPVVEMPLRASVGTFAAGPASEGHLLALSGVAASSVAEAHVASTHLGASPVAEALLNGVLAAPVIDSAEATQRDTSTTWLVDLALYVHDLTGGDDDLTVEYSTVGASGPWSTATPQPYDRKHTVGNPPVVDDLATAAPGKYYGFVWWAFFDLGEDVTQQVWLRITVTDPSALSDQVVLGPLTVTTVVNPPADYYANLLAKRARIAATDRNFLGAGPVVPVRRVSRDFAAGTGPDLVRSCVRVIFSTKAAWGEFPGDLPHRPDFGHKLWTLRHRKRNDGSTPGLVKAFVQEALGWEPRARFKSVEIEDEDPTAPGRLDVRVRYEVIDQNVSANRVTLPEFEEVIAVS